MIVFMLKVVKNAKFSNIIIHVPALSRVFCTRSRHTSLYRIFFLTYETEFVLFAHGLRQLTRDVNTDVRILNLKNNVTYALPRKTPNDVRERPLCDVKCQK